MLRTLRQEIEVLRSQLDLIEAEQTPWSSALIGDARLTLVRIVEHVDNRDKEIQQWEDRVDCLLDIMQKGYP